uniref:Immunoglobulin domain-containing protein n=1 Tax=Salmo trutta TaxID=8032 RepID=A0A673XHU3_SALTR
MSVRRRKSVQSQRFITALRMSSIVYCLFCKIIYFSYLIYWILLFFFGVLELCIGTEALTETLVELGHNATLNCSLNVTDVHWYIQHHPQPPLAILRSFSNSSIAGFYYNYTFRQKYSLETGNRLLVQNVTVDDCGVYHCAKKEKDFVLFSNGTRLMTTGLESINETTNTSFKLLDPKASEQPRDFNTTWLKGLLIGSGVLNAVLILLLSAISVLWKRAACQKNHDSPPTPEPPERADGPEYEVIQLVQTPRGPRPDCIASTIYSRVQFPNP